jgi:hypothetical protein
MASLAAFVVLLGLVVCSIAEPPPGAKKPSVVATATLVATPPPGIVDTSAGVVDCSCVCAIQGGCDEASCRATAGCTLVRNT